jgi:hypothetical protein
MNKYIRLLIYFILSWLTVTLQAAPPPNSIIDNSNYPKLDSSTGNFYFPVVKVGFSFFEVELKRISSLPMQFELLPNIKEIPEAPFPGDTAYYDIDTKLVEVPALYIYTDAGKWETWEASLNLLPDTNPLQVEFKHLEQLPFFSGLKTVKPEVTSVDLSWEAATGSDTPDQLKYEVHLSKKPDFTPDSNTLQTTLENETQYQIMGLEPNAKYYVLIIVEDGNGKRSQERNYASFSTATNSTPAPQSQTFTDVNNAVGNSEYISNPIVVKGLSATTEAKLSGGSGSLIVNGVDTGKNTAMIKNGDTIAIKTTSLFGGNGETRLTLRYDSEEVNWTLTNSKIEQAQAIKGQMSGYTSVNCQVNESGAAVCSMPITAPAGTGGLAPTLSINYSSQGSNGPLGLGFSLGGLASITRCPATMAQDGFIDSVDFDKNDRFCLNGERLMVINGEYGADGSVYFTEQNSFQKVVSYGSAGNGPASFKVWNKAGLIMEFGVTADARIEAQGREDVLVWALNKIQDTKDNYLSVFYSEDNAKGEYLPKRIDYTGNATAGLNPFASVQFFYEKRPDSVPTYIGGSLVQSTQRLTRIETWEGADVFRKYNFKFVYSVNSLYY